MSNPTSKHQKSKSADKQAFTFMASLLFAATPAVAFQPGVTPPTHPKRASIPKSPSKLQYTYSDIPEAAQSTEFDAKIRSLLQHTIKPSEEKQKQKTPKKENGLDNLKVVNSKEELKAAVLEDKDRLTVVRFHAPYCKACKKVEPLLHNFARRNPKIQFIDVPYTKDPSNRQMVHSLGVPSFPYCHVYHPASLGLVEEHSINSKYWKDFAKVIESYQDGGCDLAPHPNEDGLYGTPYKTLVEEEKIPAV